MITHQAVEEGNVAKGSNYTGKVSSSKAGAGAGGSGYAGKAGAGSVSSSHWNGPGKSRGGTAASSAGANKAHNQTASEGGTRF